jgi:hydrogenase nickel incorporation protein HypA/HybF
MHEVSLALGLVGQLESIAAEHGARRVHRFVLEVGAMSNVVPELLEDAVGIVGADRPLLRDAECVIETVALEISCAECGAVTHPDRFRFQCPACGGSAVRTERGEDLLLRNVELEIPDTEPVGREGS